jgi:hypothetical protein
MANSMTHDRNGKKNGPMRNKRLKKPQKSGLLVALAASAFTLPVPAKAESANIQNHDVQKLFMEQQCAEVLAIIDAPDPSLIGIGEMAMAFGFLMGFEVAHPGIKGKHETILSRLRFDCGNASDQTAYELLLSYSQE